MDAATARAPWQKPHGRSGGQQKCPDCLGAVDESPGLSVGAGLKTRPSVGTALSLFAPRGRRPGDDGWRAYNQIFDLTNDKEKPYRTVRGVIEVMTRSVRPTSSNPDQVQGP